MPGSKILISLLMLLMQYLLACAGSPTVNSHPTSKTVRSVATDGSGSASEGVISLHSDFSTDSHGWQAHASGYPSTLMEEVGFLAVPTSRPPLVGAQQVLEMSAANPTATVVMSLARALGASEGLQASEEYEMVARIRFISGASKECLGAGGSPGDVAIFLGAAPEPSEPHRELPEESVFLGTVDNGKPCQPNLQDYVRLTKELSEPLIVRTSEQGKLYVSFMIRGGFAGQTRLWIESIDLDLRSL